MHQVSNTLTNYTKSDAQYGSNNRLWNRCNNTSKLAWIKFHQLQLLDKFISTTKRSHNNSDKITRGAHRRERRRSWKLQPFGSPVGCQHVWGLSILHSHWHQQNITTKSVIDGAKPWWKRRKTWWIKVRIEGLILLGALTERQWPQWMFQKHHSAKSQFLATRSLGW